MNRFTFCLGGAALVALVALAPAALAGPVTSGSGTVNINFTSAGSLEFGTGTFPVTFPGSATHQYNGQIPDNDMSGPAGLGSVTYSLADADNGATFDVEISNDIEGGAISESGFTNFLLNFTTDRDLRYTFTATPRDLPLNFSTGIDGVVGASASFTIDENENTVLQGNVPQSNGEFGTFTREGVLPAGTHVFRASAESGVDAPGSGNNVFNTFGTVRLSLAEQGAPPPNPIPLPPAAWPALGMMAGMAGLRIRKALRRA